MFLPGSRYETARAFSPGPDGSTPFPGTRPRKIEAAAGIIEHLVAAGDRLDLLAEHYYNNDRLWWRIVDANPQFVLAGMLLSEDMQGGVIMIPRARE
jgi:hypothetical protein